ncbi:Band 7 protein [Carbonactinospora thermoautotrophica]|uniref:Band 7 protein n=1 Tax=Carbonactinospora thermoautotrophica TaxID=1469144 RepID=A0A132MLD2_9ACTN|nr:flotillin family protein [Carbonactinospora thermoautotrophica]KWW98636.1 Band 7 protein [Carbonactinospora thermoautotrophica]
MAVVFGIGVPVLAILIVAWVVWAARYTKVGPNRVLIVVGRSRRVVDPATGQRTVTGYRLVKGGGTFVRPIRERAYQLSLELTTLDVHAKDAYSSQGVRVSVDAVAQIKIGGATTLIERAAEQFLGRSREDIARVAFETLEGHLRAVTGTMTLEEIYLQRDRLARAVREAAREDLAAMGLEVISFTVRGITDVQGYLEAMGRPRIAQVKRDAVIGESEADRVAHQARFEAEAKVEQYRRDLELTRAGYEAEVSGKRAEADLAYELARNRVAKQVRGGEIEIEITAEEKTIELAERQVARREKNLEAEVRKTAEAERYRIEQLAEAERRRRVVEAEGAATEIRAQGQAQAEATQAVGEAEACAMARKAAAWADYNQAAVAEMFVKILPELAEKVAAPLAHTEKIVIVSTGGSSDSAAAGASRVTADVAAVLGQLPTMIEALTGVSLEHLLERLPALRRPPTTASPMPDASNRGVT